jgi:hypothetical protein
MIKVSISTKNLGFLTSKIINVNEVEQVVAYFTKLGFIVKVEEV